MDGSQNNYTVKKWDNNTYHKTTCMQTIWKCKLIHNYRSTVNSVYWEGLEGGIINKHKEIFHGDGHVCFFHYGDCFTTYVKTWNFICEVCEVHCVSVISPFICF